MPLIGSDKDNKLDKILGKPCPNGPAPDKPPKK